VYSVATAGAVALVVTWGGLQIGADRKVFLMTLAEHEASWANVVDEGRRAEALNPFRQTPKFLRATAHLRLGEEQAAVRDLEAVVQAYPFYLNALGNLGAAYLSSGRAADARRCFDRVLAVRPDDPLAHQGRDLALFRLRRPSTADATRPPESFVAVRPAPARVSQSPVPAWSGPTAARPAGS
jgi:tetratricopeptide (TPR) repeat protein